MNDNLASLYRLKRKDVKKAAKVFARAFQDDLLAKYLFPDKKFRKKILPIYFNYRIRFGVLFGEVYAPTSAIEGLAVWYKRNQFKMSNWRNLRAGGLRLMREVDKETLSRMFMINNFTTELRDNHITRNYWYLAPIGIDPRHQGKGFCSKLMRLMIKKIDGEKMETLLETQNKTNVEIYKRYGFEVVEVTTIPETTIPHWLMIRGIDQNTI